MLRAGVPVTVVLGGSDLIAWLALGSLTDRVTQGLLTTGARVRVLSTSVQTGTPIAGIASGTYAYTLTMIVESTVDRASAQDVASVLAFACYLATSYQPAEVGITRVGGIVTGTPAPGAPPTSGVATIFDNLFSFLGTLSGSLGMVYWLLIALAVYAAYSVVSNPKLLGRVVPS